MSSNYKRWQKLFLFGLGLFGGTAFCMKWMEPGFLQNGKLFTIIGLEISYSKEQVMTILSGLDDHVRALLTNHLSFDFVFMAGVYPGIAALCMMGREKTSNKNLKGLLFLLATLQLVAWACDIYENYCLLKWIKNPAIGDDFGRYHVIVGIKWVLALIGALFGIAFSLKKRK